MAPPSRGFLPYPVDFFIILFFLGGPRGARRRTGLPAPNLSRHAPRLARCLAASTVRNARERSLGAASNQPPDRSDATLHAPFVPVQRARSFSDWNADRFPSEYALVRITKAGGSISQWCSAAHDSSASEQQEPATER